MMWRERILVHKMAIFIQILLMYFTVWVCFSVGDMPEHGENFDDESQSSLYGAMEYGLIQTINGILGMDNVISTEKMKIAKGQGEIIEKLDMDNIFEQFYQHINVKSAEDKNGISKELDQFQIIIKTLDKRPMTLWVDSKTTVKSIKLEIQERKRGPSIEQQRLKFKGKELTDLQTMRECGINGNDGVAPTLQLLLRLRGGGFAHYYLNPDYFDPKFDRDFRNEDGWGIALSRGGHFYHPPYGSMRYAIKEKQNQQSNVTDSAEERDEGWPVAYHGTSEENAIDIVKEGFRLDKGKRFEHGKGIYVTPDPETAWLYAKEYTYNGKTYKLIIQTRVNPSKLKVVHQGFVYSHHTEYWLLPDSDAIRPYGICVYEIKVDSDDDMFDL